MLPNVPTYVEAEVALQKGAKVMDHVRVQLVVVHEHDVDADVFRHGHYGRDTLGLVSD